MEANKLRVIPLTALLACLPIGAFAQAPLTPTALQALINQNIVAGQTGGVRANQINPILSDLIPFTYLYFDPQTSLLRAFNGSSWVSYTTLLPVGTSGAMLCLLNSNCTVSGTWNFTSGTGIGSLTIGDINLTAVNNHELVFGSGQSIRLPANGVLEFGAQRASFSSDDIDTIVMMNLAVNGKSQFVVQPNGTPPAGVWANIAVNRVSGANEEHLNFLSLDTGYQITQIVTGSGAYRNLIFRNVGADTFTLDTNNNVTFQRPAAFGAAAGTVPYSALEVFDYLTVSQLTPGGADRGYRLRTSIPQAWSINASNVNGNLYFYDQTHGTFPLTLAPTSGLATFAGGIAASGLPTSGTVRGSLCIDTSNNFYVKTTSGACL
jgi:hypothetical protein